MSCRVNCNCHYFYGSEVTECANVKASSTFLCLAAGWAALALSPQTAPEAILKCLRVSESKIFLGGMPPDPRSGNSLSPDQPNIASYGPVTCMRTGSYHSSQNTEGGRYCKLAA